MTRQRKFVLGVVATAFLMVGLSAMPQVLPGCAALTPETADSQSRLLFAAAGGFDAAAASAQDPDLAADLHTAADAARTLATLIQAGGVEDEADRVVAFVGAAQQFLRRIAAESDDPDLRAQLQAVDVLLGTLGGLYAAQ